MAGRGWVKCFSRPYPMISFRKEQNINPERAQKLNRFIVNHYFAKLMTTMEELGVMNKQECIYNINEKGCRLCLHKQPLVLTQKGGKRVKLIAADHGENVTIVSCGNAVGSAKPPLILFKGQRIKGEWLDELPSGSIAQITSRVNMKTEVLFDWLTHFSCYKVAGSCLLVFDGVTSHLDHSITKAADRHYITLLCLPSQTTHELQPMDKSVFGPLEHYWNEHVLLFYSQSTDRTLTKQRFGKIFTEAWDKAATPANIKAGFRATGIYPFNPSIIPDEAFAPSLVIQNEDAQLSDIVTVFQASADAALSRKTRKAFPVPGTPSRVAPSSSHPVVVSEGREDVADMKRNAVIKPSQQTPEHSQVLTSNSFQSILSTPQKFLKKSKKKSVIE